MNKYDVKTKRMKDHLAKHPSDYQTVISSFMAQSDSVAYEQRQKYNRQMAVIAKLRREADAKHT